ncbi:MAG: InlB B-repeat-containing protein [Bacteroidales bacterium]|nr:InlB B-repeat-containing protein [Bacteroidales bacterium]
MKRSIFLLLAIISVAGMIAISGCKKKETYTVTFNPNGGTGTMEAQTFTEGESQALSRNAFTYDGYTFSGWNTVQGGSGASYTDGQTITATADMTLYAQWTSNGTNPAPGPTPSNTVTVTFDANGGTGEMAPQTFVIGTAQALTANAFTKGNYPFNGWNTAANGSGTGYVNMQEITISANITLYAQWSTHEFVDLGLPSGTKWATSNVGSDTPEGYGDYFAWGETTPKETYNWSTYRYCNGDYNKLTKYCNNAEYGNDGFTDALTTLEASDDAATANWGAGWRMPTREEFYELINNCTITWTTQNGVNGRLFTGPNGNSIFLPAAGGRSGSSLYGVGSGGYYWSSSLDTDDPDYAWNLVFNSGGYGMYSYDRYYGLSVRPVCVSAQN